MPRRPGRFLVIALRDPHGGFVAWSMVAADPIEAIVAAHGTQERNGAAGVTLSMRAVLDAEDRLVWGSLDGVPLSFLPSALR